MDKVSVVDLDPPFPDLFSILDDQNQKNVLLYSNIVQYVSNNLVIDKLHNLSKKKRTLKSFYIR